MSQTLSPARQLLLLGFVCAGAAAVVKTVQVTATLETRIAIQRGLTAAASNVVVQALFVTAIFAGLVSMIALAWERMTRQYERRTEERRARQEAERLEVEGHARSLRVRREIEEATRNDRGPKAA